VVVVVPAHNERSVLSRCVSAIRTAATAVTVPTSVVVVLDACGDDSEGLAGQFGPDVHFLPIEEHNVGAARAAGFRHAKSALGADKGTWYATTDADTEVGSNWLARQYDNGAEMVLGVVRVGQWRHHSEEVAELYEARYRTKALHHNHIHGANMGFSSEAYWRVGGFAPLACGEDVDLVERFKAARCRIDWDNSLWVTTSDRRNGRAPGGFADHLAEVSREVADDQERADEAS
jgi:glycosyltransferase involved in cell wall biosynthesis